MMRQCEPYSGVYVFEGIDNVGKTTIIKKLKEKIFLNIDYECVSVAFPGNESRTLGESKLMKEYIRLRILCHREKVALDLKRNIKTT